MTIPERKLIMKRSIFKTIASLSAAAMMLLAVGCGSTSDSSSAAGTNSTAAATGEDNSLQKVLDSGNTNSSMSVKWNRTAGADNYSIYIKYPGSSSFKKVKTTTSNFFTLTGMKRNTKYGIKVIANKKVKNKVWHSDSKAYNMSLV